MLHLDQLQQAHHLYAHKAVNTQTKPRRNTKKAKTKLSPKSTPIVIKDTSDANNSQLVPKRPPKLTKKVPQEQHIVPVMTETMQTIVTNKLVNPDLKTLFDVECNKELQVNVRDPDLTLFKSETPLIKPQDKVTIYQCHIPPQFEIDKALSELRSKVLRQRTINIETADLITEYDKSVHFKDVYNYILQDKLSGNANTQKKIAEAANYVVVNQLLFKIEKVKQGQIYESIPLLVIPEKFEYNIFHMYHTSLLSMHQGLWKTFLTIRNRYYIPNLFVKLRTFIQACHLCQQSKPKQKQGTPHYGYVPKDYTPLEHLALDIKYMPDGFDGFCFLIMVTCEQTNFVFAIPSKERTAQAISDALIHHVFAVSGHGLNRKSNTNFTAIITVYYADHKSMESC